jgi:glyoxylase-like metal-dependent hydrolase (beta-lactamase superfamily II)
MIRRTLGSTAILALIIVALTATSSFAQTPKRSISKVTGDVYRFQNNFHFAFVVVTGDGVVVVDPINAEAATWLKSNLKQITGKPITHLIYSHSHPDHASGGKALGAKTVIAHANAPEDIDGVKPDVRFADTKTLKIGGKTITLTWLGEGHAKDLIAVVVQPENVAFITDAASPKRLPYRDMPNSNIDGWIDQVRKIEALDFKIFAPAHGAIGVKADATDARIYMETLRDRVLQGLKAGKSIDQLASSVTMDEYKSWQQYAAWRELNVRGMGRFLKESGQVK